jgi:hypothetical protein
MTSMRQPPAIFNLPNRNDFSAVESHQESVISHFRDQFSRIDEALAAALPKAKQTFALYDGPVDLAVHAPLTRYLVKLQLESKEQLFEEDETEFNMLRVPNCGLCLRTPDGDVRILKCPPEGMPKALSDARIRFVTNNQMVFSFAEEIPLQVLALNLFVLWRMGPNHEYLGFDIACPRKADDKGEVECYWIAPWRKETTPARAAVETPQNDLEEITALPGDIDKRANS